MGLESTTRRLSGATAYKPAGLPLSYAPGNPGTSLQEIFETRVGSKPWGEITMLDNPNGNEFSTREADAVDHPDSYFELILMQTLVRISMVSRFDHLRPPGNDSIKCFRIKTLILGPPGDETQGLGAYRLPACRRKYFRFPGNTWSIRITQKNNCITI